MTCFDPEMDLWLAASARDLVQLVPRFLFQRALMTGGTCEASLFALHGRRVGALAMPLGNYHNMTPRGGIGPEFVRRSDFDHMLLLLEHLATHPPRPGLVQARRAELDAVFTRLASRLHSA
jgi:endoglucanase